MKLKTGFVEIVELTAMSFLWIKCLTGKMPCIRGLVQQILRTLSQVRLLVILLLECQKSMRLVRIRE